MRVPLIGLAPGEATLDAEAGRYVAKVHRLGRGDRFVAFDPEARTEADAEILSVAPRGEVRVRVFEPRPASVLPTRAVTLVQCVGKADKLDAVVRDATELSATAILPAISERSVATRTSEAAVARLRRVAVEAARQCGRGDVPIVEPPKPLAARFGVEADIKLILHTSAPGALRSIVEGSPTMASVVFIVGPEGGFTDREVAAAVEAGFVPVQLGRTILRTETAAAAMFGALLMLEEA